MGGEGEYIPGGEDLTKLESAAKNALTELRRISPNDSLLNKAQEAILFLSSFPNAARIAEHFSQETQIPELQGITNSRDAGEAFKVVSGALNQRIKEIRQAKYEAEKATLPVEATDYPSQYNIVVDIVSKHPTHPMAQEAMAIMQMFEMQRFSRDPNPEQFADRFGQNEHFTWASFNPNYDLKHVVDHIVRTLQTKLR